MAEDEVIEERKIVRLINDLAIKNHNLADIIIGYYNNYSQIKLKETSGYVVLNSGYNNRLFFLDEEHDGYKTWSRLSRELKLKCMKGYFDKIKNICKGIIRLFKKSMFQLIYILYENIIIVFYANSIVYMKDLSAKIFIRSKKNNTNLKRIQKRINLAKEIYKIGGDGICVKYNSSKEENGIKTITELFSYKFPYRGSELDNFILKKYKDEQLVIMNFKNE